MRESKPDRLLLRGDPTLNPVGAMPSGGRGDVRLLRASNVLGRFLVVILLTYLGLLAVTFFIGRVIPIDPVLAIVGARSPTMARTGSIGITRPMKKVTANSPR